MCYMYMSREGREGRREQGAPRGGGLVKYDEKRGLVKYDEKSWADLLFPSHMFLAR